jgi:acetyl-CoA carboxylase carboxyl transferase subunit alpha
MSSFYQLDFERPVIELEKQIDAAEARLRGLLQTEPGVAPGPGEAPVPAVESVRAEIATLRDKHAQTLRGVYTGLTAWQTVRVARHPARPQTRDYVGMLCRDFVELHGDRRFGDDPAIVCGFGRIGPVKCLLVGHQKGKQTSEKLACHFGCAHPEGYRKALMKMQLAAKYRVPIVTLVDTPGAYPGIGAEQRGQAEAIAVNLREMARLETPIVSVVIGEGGSGGALGIAVADRVAMLEHAWYSVISPEGCAAILWKEANEQTNTLAAKSLKLTARDNLSLGIVDEVIPEPVGGAHRDPHGAGAALQAWIVHQVQTLKRLSGKELLDGRYTRFRRMGAHVESAPVSGHLT